MILAICLLAVVGLVVAAVITVLNGNYAKYRNRSAGLYEFGGKTSHHNTIAFSFIVAAILVVAFAISQIA